MGWKLISLPFFILTLWGSFVAAASAPAPLEPSPDEPDVLYLINHYAKLYGVEFALADALAQIESGYDARARNTSSSAKGTYQIIDSTWTRYCTGDPLNAKDNVQCALKIIGGNLGGGLNHWLASEPTRTQLVARGLVK